MQLTITLSVMQHYKSLNHNNYNLVNTTNTQKPIHGFHVKYVNDFSYHFVLFE